MQCLFLIKRTVIPEVFCLKDELKSAMHVVESAKKNQFSF